jgi:hypothetical protein
LITTFYSKKKITLSNFMFKMKYSLKLDLWVGLSR